MSILCKNLLVCQINETNYSLSWEIDNNKIKTFLQENYNIEKIYDFQEKINYVIEIDNVETFDSINKQVFTFTSLEHNIGKLVQSCNITFIPQLEITSFYIRVKIIDGNYTFNVKINDIKQDINVEINNEFSLPYNITIEKDLTLDIIKAMYNGIPDSHAYSKGAYDANFYYILQCFAIQDNDLFNKLKYNVKNNFFLYKSSPYELNNSFGGMLQFNEPNDIIDEEYRRILIELFKSLQIAGTENSILNVLKYLTGDDNTITYFNNFYSWILRQKDYQLRSQQYDPDNVNLPPNPCYSNKSSNYFLFKQYDEQGKNWESANRKNKIMLLNKNFKLFCFNINSDNFFNNNININAIKQIVDKLKPLYTKYFLNIDSKEE